jgi:molybdate transport system substrate-binding protein
VSEEVSQAVETEEPTDEAETLEAAEIQVFIAASLENAFKDIIALYNESQPNVTVTYNADSSGTLLTQIEEGYECDIFFSAATSQINTAEEEGLAIEGSRVDLLQNEVVLITWKDSGTAVTGIENIADASSIALADGSVPVGKYTRVALQNLGVLDSSLTAKDITTEEVSEALGGVEINECGNVSKVKEAIKEGSNEVGTVYYSDAYSVIDDVDIIEHISTELTGDIIYPMIRTVNGEADDAQTAAADDFYAFLQTSEVMDIFEQYMFVSNVG